MDGEINRLRVTADFFYRGPPLSNPHQTMISNRVHTYLRTASWEGLEGKIEVVFDDRLKNVHSHHHDARYERCRPDYNASHDELGPIE